MGMWVEGYSMYEKERWDEAERYGREIGINEGMSIGRSEGLNEGMSKGRETERTRIAESLKSYGISEEIIKAVITPNTAT